ncbi:MAG: hypothetical protein L6R28_25190, partial [Planctomycetes bacterium]|nr:hypothetical protein [Planctomycetota bacterium]
VAPEGPAQRTAEGRAPSPGCVYRRGPGTGTAVPLRIAEFGLRILGWEGKEKDELEPEVQGKCDARIQTTETDCFPFQVPGSWFLVPGSWFLVSNSDFAAERR